MGFKKAITISLAGHLAFFGIFNFSFGNKIPLVSYNNVSFFGQVLPSSDLKERGERLILKALPDRFWGKLNHQLQKRSEQDENKSGALPSFFNISILEYSKKPAEAGLFSEKISFRAKLKPPEASLKRKKEQVVMFYPRLPYQYLLFFKDRQRAHIEIEFSIASSTVPNSIMVKRKISSGNLEADLLTMRYISRYLSIEQKNFAADNWQTVKIDLSAKE